MGQEVRATPLLGNAEDESQCQRRQQGGQLPARRHSARHKEQPQPAIAGAGVAGGKAASGLLRRNPLAEQRHMNIRPPVARQVPGAIHLGHFLQHVHQHGPQKRRAEQVEKAGTPRGQWPVEHAQQQGPEQRHRDHPHQRAAPIVNQRIGEPGVAPRPALVAQGIDGVGQQQVGVGGVQQQQGGSEENTWEDNEAQDVGAKGVGHEGAGPGVSDRTPC